MTATVQLLRPLQRQIRSGHPWLYRDALSPVRHAPGTVVKVLEKGGRPLAMGLCDEGPIAVRVFSTRPFEAFGEALLSRRVEAALQLRQRVVPPETTAYRLLHGEGDRLPGLTCDRYGEWAVVKLDGELLWPHLPLLRTVLEASLRTLGVRGALLRGSRRSGGGEKSAPLFGEVPREEVQVLECGMTLRADLWSGQKTGLFLDHRPYRARVRELASGCTVLNLYGYTGGFSCAAGLGGAREVTTVDVARAAVTTAERTFIDNGLSASSHRALCQDVPEFLEQEQKAGARYDVIVADPPNFAPSERALPAAMESYAKLHGACLSLLGPGGLYLAGSCSSHVRMADFMESLRKGAQRARRVLRVLEQGGAPADHPRLLAFPEGDYLKVVLCLVEPD